MILSMRFFAEIAAILIDQLRELKQTDSQYQIDISGLPQRDDSRFEVLEMAAQSTFLPFRGTGAERHAMNEAQDEQDELLKKCALRDVLVDQRQKTSQRENLPAITPEIEALIKSD